MGNPFDLRDEASYLAWRETKLGPYRAGTPDIGVELRQLSSPTRAERAELARLVAAFNMALVRVDPTQIKPADLLAFGHAMGLHRADSNLFADADALSRIETGGPRDPRGDYIPYTSRALSWHTDGYYNPETRQVCAWTLFCLRPARVGGENRLLDHEIAYILLRDASPDHIAALGHPETLRIPANLDRGVVIRPESVGPVFSVLKGRLHMRYTARQRHAIWRETPETRAARQALDRLFSESHVYTFTHRLQAGEGLVSNNVLHDRSGFDDDQAVRGRTLYRVRYRDSIALATAA
jgi:hypothetical protein